MTTELNLGKEVHEVKRGTNVSEKVEKTIHRKFGCSRRVLEARY